MNPEPTKRIDNRLTQFSISVCLLLEHLPHTLGIRRMGDQLLRSATSIGANYEEATAAESRADFIHKLQISLKESRETCYWLRVLGGCLTSQSDHLQNVLDEACQIRAMLTKAVSTAKSRMTT